MFCFICSKNNEYFVSEFLNALKVSSCGYITESSLEPAFVKLILSLEQSLNLDWIPLSESNQIVSDAVKTLSCLDSIDIAQSGHNSIEKYTKQSNYEMANYNDNSASSSINSTLHDTEKRISTVVTSQNTDVNCNNATIKTTNLGNDRSTWKILRL